MKKQILIYGTLAGIISIASFLIAMITGYNGMMENGQLIGYSSQVVGFSLIFVAIRNHRDKTNNGFISFGKAFKIGALITLVAGLIYLLMWTFYYHNYMPDFMEVYTKQMLEQHKKDGMSQEEISEAAKKLEFWAGIYKNPIGFSLITLVEIVPTGLLLSLIAALILKKKQENH